MTSASRSLITLRPGQARALSVAVMAALGVGYLGDAVWGAASPTLALAFGLQKLFGLVGAIVLFLDSHGQEANAPDRLLDERQRAERDRAYVRAYQIIVTGMFAIFLYTIPAQSFGWWLPGIGKAIDMLSAYAIASLALPGIILAWRAVTES